MKNIPFWQDINTTKTYPTLKKDIDADVLIIGAGITGSNVFYQLKDTNLKIVMVEKNKIGFGCSSRSSAKITFLQENIYTKINNNYNKETSYLYYKSQKDAIKIIVNIIKKENIDCDFKKTESYLYTMNSQNISKIKKEEEILKSFGENIKKITTLPNNRKVKYGISVSNTYLFHPLKFIEQLVQKSINDHNMVYENTTIIKIEKTKDVFKCYTKNNIINAKYVVLSLHYPYFLIPYFTPLKCYIEKSYLGLTNYNNEKDFCAINLDKPLISLRTYNNNLLFVSESKNLAFAFNDLEMVNNFFNNTNISDYDYLWSNHDLMTLDRLPLIGFIKDNLILATGYNTWGNTNGILAGAIIKDLILKKENKYQKIFDPYRNFNAYKYINYPINIFSNTYSFINSKINKNKSYYKKNPYFTKRNGKNIAIYKDSKGICHVVYNRCPHLKCSLIFNEIEKTWDCPCHGSRFDIDGKCIMGPSNYDIRYK